MIYQPHAAEKIIARTQPCKCGCKGQDSQHAATFKRVVKDVHFLDEVQTVWVGQGHVNIVATGTVQLPDGLARVGFEVVEFSHCRPMGWRVLERRINQ